jgi:ribosomal protein S18 acetylase RimI-like enzyme
MHEVRIRRATPADVGALHELARSAYQPYVETIGVRPAPLDADYAASVTDPRHEVWVAERGTAVVGLLVLVRYDDHLLLENVAVLAPAQGTGNGTLLLNLAERRAIAQGLDEVRLFTHQQMTRNIALYTARGYRETSREIDDGFHRVFLSKHLDGSPSSRTSGGAVTDAEALASDAGALAAAGLQWLVEQARETPGGLAWTTHPDDDELDPTLYSGAAGNALTLLEAAQDIDDERYADLARDAIGPLVAAVETTEHASLYFGRTGIAVALHALGHHLGQPAATAAAARALDLVEAGFDGERWNVQFELMGGNAGIALGALAAGRPELALLALSPYLRTIEPTAGGVQWEVRQETPARFHHISHGTLGIAHALARVGAATGRDDMVELALLGAADVVSRNEAGPDDFLVPHSDPQHRPELIERYSYGWCHGPAGDAQAFRLLASVTGDAAWDTLGDRCWHTVTQSGLPARLRPGFWDNSGRCCGTAGVLALATDRYAERRSDLGFARVLVDDLAERATVDEHGARWSNVEHRVTPSELPPRAGWAMGNAGIVRELLRLQRVLSGGRADDTVPWPDHPSVRR